MKAITGLWPPNEKVRDVLLNLRDALARSGFWPRVKQASFTGRKLGQKKDPHLVPHQPSMTSIYAVVIKYNSGSHLLALPEPKQKARPDGSPTGPSWDSMPKHSHLKSPRMKFTYKANKKKGKVEWTFSLSPGILFWLFGLPS